ncbi:hypothetical protein [Demequina sp. NBRC 110053]|uniref:hypothetical protein n=1 Tax=Demequina sp. NBRC 110053 TaxID=1570342 RepID=UPI000A05A817|nr:hypothetical protein [Demequina sp. NBRC 110053]
MADETVALDIPGARGNVALQGAEGVFYKVLIDGQPIKRAKGHWPIPMRNGSTGKLESRGILPGFQKLVMGDREVYQMGAHATTLEKSLMFLPLLLVVFLFPGMVLALILFFMNVFVVKNAQFPRALRVALPIVNTLAGGIILAILTGLV